MRQKTGATRHSSSLGLTGAYRSYDVIGDIIVAKIPRRPEVREEEIGRALLEANRRARLVLKVAGGTDPTSRRRELRPIAGSGPTTTVHREHGASYSVDVAKVFFTPRLSYERLRIARQVAEGEVVLNAFSGAGSFSLLIARWKRADVLSLDINQDAIKCMRAGIGRNDLLGRVLPVLGDARRPCLPPRSVDRALLPLPALSDEVLGPIAEAVRHGGTIHTCREASGKRRECISSSLRSLQRVLVTLGPGDSFEVLASRVIRPVGPKRWHVVHDLLIHHPPSSRKKFELSM